MRVVIGVGAAGPCARAQVEAGLIALRQHPLWSLCAASDVVDSAAVGGVTSLPFCNAAVVVDTALSLPALLSALHAVEARLGRVRTPSMPRHGARALDLDVLWSLDAVAPSSASAGARVAVPHPALSTRWFARFPAAQAIGRLGHERP
jgi:2-amino-4-hydroxy-6-hydroxymethyldihydropteridine diphosphokinase